MTVTTLTGTALTDTARYCCNRCGIAAPEPIVKPVANLRFPEDGRCSNVQACDRRADADVRLARKRKRR